MEEAPPVARRAHRVTTGRTPILVPSAQLACTRAGRPTPSATTARTARRPQVGWLRAAPAQADPTPVSDSPGVMPVLPAPTLPPEPLNASLVMQVLTRINTTRRDVPAAVRALTRVSAPKLAPNALLARTRTYFVKADVSRALLGRMPVTQVLVAAPSALQAATATSPAKVPASSAPLASQLTVLPDDLGAHSVLLVNTQ